MESLKGVTLNIFEREYDLGYGRQPSGLNWLMAINRETGAVLPLTTIGGPPAPPNSLQVIDVAGIVPALESAGIVKRIGRSGTCEGLTLCRCEIVHDELVRSLAAIKPAAIEVEHQRDGLSR